MKPAVLLAIMFGSVAPMLAGEIAITSPDHARTFAYGEMISHQLYVDPASGVLIPACRLIESIGPCSPALAMENK